MNDGTIRPAEHVSLPEIDGLLPNGERVYLWEFEVLSRGDSGQK